MNCFPPYQYITSWWVLGHQLTKSLMFSKPLLWISDCADWLIIESSNVLNMHVFGSVEGNQMSQPLLCLLETPGVCVFPLCLSLSLRLITWWRHGCGADTPVPPHLQSTADLFLVLSPTHGQRVQLYFCSPVFLPHIFCLGLPWLSVFFLSLVDSYLCFQLSLEPSQFQRTHSPLSQALSNSLKCICSASGLCVSTLESYMNLMWHQRRWRHCYVYIATMLPKSEKSVK